MATIQGIYVALFGRPADPAGLAYFNSVTKNGADLSAIGNLAGQKEYTARFDGLNNAQIINTIYQSLFGRDADAAGLEYFAGQLIAGNLTINNIAIAILDGAAWSTDKTIVTNKIAAADMFTQSLDTAVEVASYTGMGATYAARAFLRGVTTTAATKSDVDAAIKSMMIASNAKVAFRTVTEITVDTNQANDLTVNAGADSDLFSIDNPGKVGTVDDATTNADFIETLVTIGKLSSTADFFDFRALDDTVDLNNVQRGNITTAADLLVASPANDFALLTYEEDAYVFAENANGALDAGDTLIKITGISNVSAFTDAHFIA